MHSKHLHVLSLPFLALTLTLSLNGCASGSKKQEEQARAQADAQAAAQKTSEEQVAQEEALPAKLADERALNQLNQFSQNEMAISQMALEKAESNAVKQHAQMLIEDHQGLQRHVQAAAEQVEISLAPYSPSSTDQQVISRLSGIAGAPFDKAYLSQMMLDHRTALQELRLLRRSTDNSQVVELIDQALPRFEQHRYSTARVANNIGISTEPGTGFAE